MTDQELLSQYGGYSDDQLTEFILGGIPDWQREQFQRVLRLRRRKAYEDLVGTERPASPPPLPIGFGEPKRAQATSQETPIEEPTNIQKGQKKKGLGFGCLMLWIIALIIFLVIMSHS